MGLKEEFEEYLEKVNKLARLTPTDVLAYALSRQATIGPVNSSRPGSVGGQAKWDAWKAIEGKSKEDAMSEFITLAKLLIETAPKQGPGLGVFIRGLPS